MSKRYHKSLAFIVLVSFLALLTPKSLWHDHSHGAHFSTVSKKDPASHSKHSFDQGIEKCSICDLHIPLLSTPLSEVRIAFYQLFETEFALISATPELTATHSHFLRGPPALMNA